MAPGNLVRQEFGPSNHIPHYNRMIMLSGSGRNGLGKISCSRYVPVVSPASPLWRGWLARLTSLCVLVPELPLLVDNCLVLAPPLFAALNCQFEGLHDVAFSKCVEQEVTVMSERPIRIARLTMHYTTALRSKYFPGCQYSIILLGL